MTDFKVALTGVLKDVLKGLQNSRFETEADFRDTLLEKASEVMKDWTWYKEQNFVCSTLNNVQGIKVDLVAKNKHTNDSIVIELKYAKPDAGDRIAFPYDVLWDCAKIETMLSGEPYARYPRSTSVEHPSVIYGFCIFLSCLNGHFYHEAWGNTSWSRNYFHALRNENPITGHILTHKQRQGLDNVIFNNNRPHISLGLDWTREIVLGFNVENDNSHRLMLLSPDIGKTFHYQHHPDDIRTIPFLKDETRNDWLESKGGEATTARPSRDDQATEARTTKYVLERKLHDADDRSEQLRSELIQKLKDTSQLFDRYRSQLNDVQQTCDASLAEIDALIRKLNS